jgi:HD-GYP domain-containing protein (c-di-GMP phosphodiesterase class II)
MKKSQEIWFFKDSSVARLLRPLSRNYKLHGTDRAMRNGRGDAEGLEPVGPAVWLANPASDNAPALRRLARCRPGLRLVAVTTGRSPRINGGEWFACLPANSPSALLARTVESAFANIELSERESSAREELARAEREREELNRIGVALSSTHDVTALLEMILAKTRDITGADAGSLYLVEAERTENGRGGPGSKLERRLRFKATQNDSLQFPFVEYSIPIAENSLAGYAALHGEVIALDDAYAVPANRPYRFNPRYDEETGYRTRSLLTVPMKDARGEVIGVVQLLNCKRARATCLLTSADLDRAVQPFPPRAVRLAESLASQAAVAYENSKLYGDIEALFEGFVQAAVMAIEQRDPTTSGHSLRVSQMTVGLAEIVDRCEAGPYRGIRFTRDQMKEIRYAGLLHDFGKLGVREEVLVKAKKLYPSQFDIVQTRFDYMRKELEAQYERRKADILLGASRKEALHAVGAIDKELRVRLAELDDAMAKVVEANEPTVLAEGEFEQLFNLARKTYRDARGVEQPMLTPDEVRFLSISQGSLDAVERQQIESHVVHSFNFLMQIPWTREIRGIPEIARAHHEKLNGTGYPYRLKGEEIPIQARMMTICDIFDALSAADRPYKKAVPVEHALTILEDSVVRKELDAGLFKMFLEARVYERAGKRD